MRLVPDGEGVVAVVEDADEPVAGSEKLKKAENIFSMILSPGACGYRIHKTPFFS
jgi:hypothetical protein